MTDYRDQLATAVGAVTLQPPLGYTWLGRRSRPLPKWLREALSAPERRAFLIDCVSGELYASFYTRGRVEPAHWLKPQPIGADPQLIAAVRAAGAARGAREDGWTVERLDGEAAVLSSPYLRVRAPLSACRPNGAGLTPGAAVTVALEGELPGLSPGHLTLVEGELAGDVVRVYWHVTAAGAPALVGELTTSLRAAAVPYRLKVSQHPLRFNRADAAVLYLQASDFPALRERLAAIAGSHAASLRPRVPALTLALAPGVALAEDPRGESFGEHRCRLIAEALVTAQEEGARDRLGYVIRRFEGAGVDPAAPYREPTMAGRHVL
jgi:hypothetical protein